MQLAIDPIPASLVSSSTDQFNSSNLEPSDLAGVEDPISDHWSIISRTFVREWIHLKDVNHRTLPLSSHTVSSLADACAVFRLTGRERLDELPDDLPAELDSLTAGGQWFVRFEEVSLKEGKHGAGPYTSGRQMLESILSDKRVNSLVARLRREGGGTTLYAVPWDTEIRPEHEWRVFVFRRNITAMSQYRWHEDVGFTSTSAGEAARRIVEFHDGQLLQRFPAGFPDSYVLDVCAVPGGPVKLVEFNPFGAQLGAGSALFHWKRDYAILHAADGSICVRYVERD